MGTRTGFAADAGPARGLCDSGRQANRLQFRTTRARDSIRAEPRGI